VTTTFSGNPSQLATSHAITTPPEQRAGRFYGVPQRAADPDEALDSSMGPLPELPHRGMQQAGHRGEIANWQWNPAPSDMLGLLEMQVTLGTFGRVTDSTQDALAGLRRLVRTWARPHLSPGEPGDPCAGCGGAILNQDCPYQSLLLEVVTEVSRGSASPTAESG
jgi:hypothetical protein